MSNINTVLYDKGVDRAAMVRMYEANTSDKINLIIDGHAVRVDNLIKKSKLSGVGFNEFSKNLSAEINKLAENTYNVSSRSMLDLFHAQVNHTTSSISSVIGKIWKTKQPTRQVAESIVLKTPLYSNTVLEQGWIGIARNEKVRIEGIIRKGIAAGLTEDAIAKDVFKSAYGITKNQAKGLTVTGMTSVYSQADQQVYKLNEDVLQGWQYVAVLDARTTTLCASLDGKIYPADDTEHLPPRHWYCRSTTTPVVKKYEDLLKLENIAQIRKRNLAGLTDKEVAMYDGMTPLKESYNAWLLRQPRITQIKHLGDMSKLSAFQSGQLYLSNFSTNGNRLGIRDLAQATETSFGVAGDSRRYVMAKEKLDTLKLGASTPEDIFSDLDIQKSLKEYYLLQAGELDGTLSLTNYRGTVIGSKKANKTRVLRSPPTEVNLKFNPLTGRYDDARVFQPNPDALSNSLRLVTDSDKLLDADKTFIHTFVNDLEDSMSVNERAVVTENLRIVLSRFRDNGEKWKNLKAVLQGQVKFDVMNVSDYMETQLRKDMGLLKRLKQANYLDPVLGPTQLDDLSKNFISNIRRKNKWEDSVAPTIAKELRNVLDYKIPVKLKIRLKEQDLANFYLKFANRLSLADSPDRDQLAVALGRDLFNMANYRGSRNEWYKVGLRLLDDANDKGFYKLETYGVQKRRMKSRNGGKYFGPYYDTFSVNLRIVDPRIQEYSKLGRQVDVGLRLGVFDKKNRLYVREGYKTYQIDDGVLGWYDSRIPITSTSSFTDFPVSVVNKDMEAALNWASSTEYRIDKDFHDFIENLINFRDDKGKAEFYDNLNHYKEYLISRGDAYERLKTMKWLRDKDVAFSNPAFLDHRARIYERGFIGPQSGETFRPFLSTGVSRNYSRDEFLNLQDQIGGFLGGLSDRLEGKHNSLSVLGRQQIALDLRKDLIELGYRMRRAKPADIRAILESPLVQAIEGEEQGKAFRLALEMSKINDFLGGDFSNNNLLKLSGYVTDLALEQDASSSGAQIIALTTKNKQLAMLSNVVPTNQKQRLYDEIAASTFNDPRFKKLNEKLMLTEKDLRKAAKA